MGRLVWNHPVTASGTVNWGQGKFIGTQFSMKSFRGARTHCSHLVGAHACQISHSYWLNHYKSNRRGVEIINPIMKRFPVFGDPLKEQMFLRLRSQTTNIQCHTKHTRYVLMCRHYRKTDGLSFTSFCIYFQNRVFTMIWFMMTQ